MAKTDLAEAILTTYVQSADIGPDHPDYRLFKQECESIRAVLRLIADHNRKNSRVGHPTPATNHAKEPAS